VGFAFGAAVAMELAARDGSGLSGLVLIGVPSAGNAPYDRMPRAMRRDQQQRLNEILRSFAGRVKS
jgi:hypothetical protein